MFIPNWLISTTRMVWFKEWSRNLCFTFRTLFPEHHSGWAAQLAQHRQYTLAGLPGQSEDRSMNVDA
jgi:hypothetical protein